MNPNQKGAPDPSATTGHTVSPLSVIGWTLLCFALIPLTMAGHGDGKGYTETAIALTVISLFLIVAGRLKRRKEASPTG